MSNRRDFRALLDDISDEEISLVLLMPIDALSISGLFAILHYAQK